MAYSTEGPAQLTEGVIPLREFWGVVLFAFLLVFSVGQSWGQTPTALQEQQASSISDSIERARAKEIQLNFFYVHGIGINPPSKKLEGTQDFEVSLPFRKSFCQTVNCTMRKSGGELLGRDYASKDDFALGAQPPELWYLGQKLWKSGVNSDGSYSYDDWRAAAPFVDHYKLVAYDKNDKDHKNPTVYYVHEINWWPLVLSAKCRQIIANEPALVDRDERHLAICSAKKTGTAADSQHSGRFRSYNWLAGVEVSKRDPPWPKGAAGNRWLKHDLLDWSFADALLAVGPLKKYLLESIQELVLDSYSPADRQEFIVVSHSLGSYLMFSALDEEGDMKCDSDDPFGKVLSQTSKAYFMANQLSLLELANLDFGQNGKWPHYLQRWSSLRSCTGQHSPRIIAFSDPDDLLTWQVPPLNQSDTNGPNNLDIAVRNLPAKNTVWRWLIANPLNAHLNYDQNKRVIRTMVPKSNPHPSEGPKR